MTRPELLGIGAPKTGTVAITGATGFIGGHLVRLLAERGWRQRLLIRGISLLGTLPRGVEIVLGDLDDRAALQRLVTDVVAVIYVAGVIRARDAGEFHRVNAGGTEALLQACRSMPSRKAVILLSSLAAREPQLSAYAASKRAGEIAAEKLADDLPWTAIRAPVVYGPADRETLAIFRLASLRIAPITGGAHCRLSLIHVNDLARAIADLLERPASPGVYEIDDGATDGYSLAEIVTFAGEASGRRPRLFPVPRTAMTSLAVLSQLAARATGRPGILTTGKVREMWHDDWVARDRRLAAMLDFRACFDIHSGFRNTIAWYRDHNWL